jgi:hypothetical protein
MTLLDPVDKVSITAQTKSTQCLGYKKELIFRVTYRYRNPLVLIVFGHKIHLTFNKPIKIILRILMFLLNFNLKFSVTHKVHYPQATLTSRTSI